MAAPVFRSKHLEFIQWVFNYLATLQLLVVSVRVKERASGAYLHFVGVCATKATVCVS